MAYGKVYFSVYNLKYKEITHRESSGRGYSRRNTHGWTLSHTYGWRDYRWEKRQAAKYSRKVARADIVGQLVSEFDPGDELGYTFVRLGNLAGDAWIFTWYENVVVFEFMHGMNCHICGKPGGH